MVSPQARTHDKQQPFGHLIIKDLIVNQWFGSKGEGVKHPSVFKDIPSPLLALVSVAVIFLSFRNNVLNF